MAKKTQLGPGATPGRRYKGFQPKTEAPEVPEEEAPAAAVASERPGISWLDMVVRVEPEYYVADVAYEFSGGRKFLSTDKNNTF